MKAKNLKKAMLSDMFKLKNIYFGGDKLRIDFEPRFSNSSYKNCSFWVNRNYFEKTYKSVYSRLLM
jgi:hypothetical protein